MKIIQTIKFWMENARYYATVQSFCGSFLAICLASNSTNFNPIHSILALLGVFFAHLTINLLDDYYDFKSGSVEKRLKAQGTVRSGKCKYLLDNSTTLKELFASACIFGILAILIGLFLFLQKGLPVIIIALIAGFLGFFYSAPPLKLSYRGLGEFVVGAMFGPLLMIGVFYCACETITPQLVLISFVTGFLVTNIIYVHSILDIISDKANDKKTLATILPNKNLQFFIFLLFSFFPYFLIILGLIKYNLPKLCLTTMLILPLSFVLGKFMLETINNIKKEHSPRFWMGKMENWEKIKAVGLDWFMIRWFLSRNIMAYFSIILSIVFILEKITK